MRVGARNSSMCLTHIGKTVFTQPERCAHPGNRKLTGEAYLMDSKQLLLTQTHEAYVGDDEMSLKVAVEALTQAEASWRLNETTWTIEEILYHVASCKIEYCRQGFGRWTEEYAKPIGDVEAMMALLDRAHEHLVQCLESCSGAALEAPIPTRSHGKSAAHFFWIMIMHDITHASEIGMIRRAYGTWTDYYPV
jgi:hypothetical protein